MASVNFTTKPLMLMLYAQGDNLPFIQLNNHMVDTPLNL